MRHLHDARGRCLLSDPEPVGQAVSHCNRSTGWVLVKHVYQPDACAECVRLASLYVDCPKEST